MSPDKVNKAEVVKSKTRYVSVVDEVLSLFFKLIVLSPVPADGEDCSRSFLNRDDVRKGNPRLVVIFVDIWIPRKLYIDVHFEELETVVH